MNRILVALISMVLFGCSSNDITPEQKLILDGINERIETRISKEEVNTKRRDLGEIGIVISFSGGGIRASNLAIGFLLGMDAIELNNGVSMLQEVDVASTVSGGGVGVGVYIAEKWEEKCLSKDKIGNTPFYYLLVDDQKRGINRLDRLRNPWIGALLNKLSPETWSVTVTNTNKFIRSELSPLLKVTDCKGQYTRLPLSAAQEEAISFEHIPNATTSGKGTVFPIHSKRLKSIGLTGFVDSQLGTNGQLISRWKEIDYKNFTDKLISDIFPYELAIAASAAFPPLMSDIRLRVESEGVQKFLHITDGGQADDNGYDTALKAISRLSKTHTRKPVVYIAVDALPDKGTLVTTSEETAGIIKMIFRNMDLPRYGNKRTLGNTIDKDEYQRIKTDLDSTYGNVWAGHYGLWEHSNSLAKVPTLTAGRRGLKLKEQKATIKAGMLAAFSTVLGIQDSLELNARVDSVISCLFISDNCDSETNWLLLKRHLSNQLPNNVDNLESGLTEFRREIKLNEWSARFQGNISHLNKLEKKINQEHISWQEASKKMFTDRENELNSLVEKVRKIFNEEVDEVTNKIFIDSALNQISDTEKKSSFMRGELKKFRELNNISKDINYELIKVMNASKEVSCDDVDYTVIEPKPNGVCDSIRVEPFIEVNSLIGSDVSLTKDPLGETVKIFKESLHKVGTEIIKLYDKFTGLFRKLEVNHAAQRSIFCQRRDLVMKVIKAKNILATKKLVKLIGTYKDLSSAFSFEGNCKKIRVQSDDSLYLKSSGHMMLAAQSSALEKRKSRFSSYAKCVEGVRDNSEKAYLNSVKLVEKDILNIKTQLNVALKKSLQCNSMLRNLLDGRQISPSENEVNMCLLELYSEDLYEVGLEKHIQSHIESTSNNFGKNSSCSIDNNSVENLDPEVIKSLSVRNDEMYIQEFNKSLVHEAKAISKFKENLSSLSKKRESISIESIEAIWKCFPKRSRLNIVEIAKYDFRQPSFVCANKADFKFKD